MSTRSSGGVLTSRLLELICSVYVLVGWMVARDGSTSRRMIGTLKIAGVALVALVSAAIGSAMSGHFGMSNYTLSYADFISIMLTAISLLMTVLAIFLAVLGFIGWTSIEQKAHSKTEGYLEEGFKENGKLFQMLSDRVELEIRAKTQEIMFEGIQPIDADPTSDGDEEGQ